MTEFLASTWALWGLGGIGLYAKAFRLKSDVSTNVTSIGGCLLLIPAIFGGIAAIQGIR